MGCHCSKRTTSATPRSSLAAASGNISFILELNSYSEACRVDPEIQSFDACLHQRTNRAISNVAANVHLSSLSFDTVKEVTACLLEMNQEVVHVILDCKKEIWKNPELFDLVEDYFDNGIHTLNFCTALEKCLKNAQNSQLIVHLALQCFDEEALTADAGGDLTLEESGKTKYEKTLDELRRFKKNSDPFTEEFFQAFPSVYQQQLSMLEKVRLKSKKLDKKLKSVEAWRKLSCIIFASAFSMLLICSVVAAIVAAPPIAAAISAACSAPMGYMGKWFDSMWNVYREAIKGEKMILSSVQAGTFIVISDMDGIRVMVNMLEGQISSLLENTEFSFREEEAVRFGIEEIRKKMGMFIKSIEDLVVQADQCRRDIVRARTGVLQRIIEHPK